MKVTVIPTVIGALGTVSKALQKVLEDKEILEHMETIIMKIGQNTEKSPF